MLQTQFEKRHSNSRRLEAIKSAGKKETRKSGRGGIRTHATEVTGALNQRLRPLGHPTNSRDNSVSLGYLKQRTCSIDLAVDMLIQCLL